MCEHDFLWFIILKCSKAYAKNIWQIPEHRKMGKGGGGFDRFSFEEFAYIFLLSRYNFLFISIRCEYNGWKIIKMKMATKWNKV